MCRVWVVYGAFALLLWLAVWWWCCGGTWWGVFRVGSVCGAHAVWGSVEGSSPVGVPLVEEGFIVSVFRPGGWGGAGYLVLFHWLGVRPCVDIHVGSYRRCRVHGVDIEFNWGSWVCFVLGLLGLAGSFGSRGLLWPLWMGLGSWTWGV